MTHWRNISIQRGKAIRLWYEAARHTVNVDHGRFQEGRSQMVLLCCAAETQFSRWAGDLEGEQNMTETIYDALRESHEIQRALCRKLLRAKEDEGRRQHLCRELRIELAAHAAAEERYLYVPILMHDMGLDPSRHALSEHHEVDECVEELTDSDIESRDWLEKARQLSEIVHHHLKEEETKFFQISGKILTDIQKSKLANQYRKDYMRVRQKLADT